MAKTRYHDLWKSLTKDCAECPYFDQQPGPHGSRARGYCYWGVDRKRLSPVETEGQRACGLIKKPSPRKGGFPKENNAT